MRRAIPVFALFVAGFLLMNRDRRKAALDNIQKFLDIVRSMNPQL